MSDPDAATSPMPRVLLAEASLPMRRVMREAMTAFRQCEVDDAPSGERAFELALQRPYELFLFSLELADLNGDQLDRLLAQAYPLAHLGRHTSPPVIFLASNATHPSLAPLRTNARVLGILSLPPKIDQILSLTQRILPPRNDAGAPPFPPHVP